jgi:hypothetical protein
MSIARSPDCYWAINDKRVDPIWRREGLSPARSPRAVGFGWPTGHVSGYGRSTATMFGPTTPCRGPHQPWTGGRYRKELTHAKCPNSTAHEVVTQWRNVSRASREICFIALVGALNQRPQRAPITWNGYRRVNPAIPMSREQCVIAVRADPTFEACPLKSSSGWYVKVLWHYGQEQHVGRFVSIDDAQSWITENAEGWLRNRTAALRSRGHQGPPQIATSVR